jgi:hypothetical protein
LITLLEKYYPVIKWNLPAENELLWNNLKDFIQNYYLGISRQFDLGKFEEASKLTFDDLKKIMEITRQTWVWFFEKIFNINFDDNLDEYKYFTNKYYIFE